jgi:hypothetical protein
VRHRKRMKQDRGGANTTPAIPELRVWTVQDMAVWENLQTEKALFVDEKLVRWVPPEYRWLTRRLQRRFRSFTGRLPWWFYCTRPDLRWVRHRVPIGESAVRIEMHIPQDRVFVMPAWAWHMIRSGRALALCHAEHAAAQRYNRRSRLRSLANERLFDERIPDAPWPGFEQAFLIRPEGFEAVCEELRLEWVSGVSRFVGVSRKTQCRQRLPGDLRHFGRRA